MEMGNYISLSSLLSTMRRRGFIASMGIGVAGTLSGCIGHFTSNVSETFSSTHTVVDEATVAIRNRNGPVNVQKANDNKLTVSGTKQARSQEGLDSIDIEVIEDKQFVINVRFGSDSNVSDRNVALTVEVPEGVPVDRADTANGDVTVTGVEGDLHAMTSNGEIEVAGVTGFVSGETTNGDVQIRDTTGLSGARTTNGSVDVELYAMRNDVTCSSSNGNVTVRVGPDISGAIRLSTNAGRATVRDLPYTSAVDRNGYLEGSLRNGESPELSLETNNGDVTLRAA